MQHFTWLKGAGISVMLMALAACSSTEIQVYSGNTPKLNMREFFNGKLTAHGIVKNRSGKVIRYFNATIDAYWDNDGVGYLDETFVFSDGERQERVWKLVPAGENTFVATANDTVGESIAETSGNALFLNYVLELPYKGSTMNVNVDDRMYLVNENTLLNESVLKKFGFRVASIALVIEKQ